MWKRFQVFLVLQSLILTGVYAVHFHWTSWVLAWLGSLMTLALAAVALADYGDRERLRPVIEELWRKLLIASSVRSAGEFATHPFTAQPRWKRQINASSLIILLMGFFFFLDAAIGVVLLRWPHLLWNLPQ
jgi:hypothetical protein